MNPNRKNLANAFLAAPITAAATTMTYVTGYGAGKPAVPYFDTLTPQGQLSTMGNSEIVEVTALSGDTATIVRARKGTDAKSFPAGTIASNGIYVEDKIGSQNIDFTTFGAVDIQSLVSESTASLTVVATAPSIIHATAAARHASGTSANFRILFSAASGSVIKSGTTSTSQDQQYRLLQATGYAYVTPGTYTVSRGVSGGSRDNQSILAAVVPVIAPVT